ncbi:MAG: enoyl-CoA hydratase [Acidimicrobiales bacterium]|nr:enoyl-CoA hydratase [Acidimicrobiales bacterium]
MSRLLVDITDRVATVTINDPKRRNAFDLAMCDEVKEAFDELDNNPDVGAIVITGAAPAFCAGAELTHLGTSTRQGLLAIYEGFLRVGRSPKPTISAVNGPAVGAGMNLALITDLRVAGVSARFDARFLQLGIHSGGGHSWMLRRLCGPEVAFALDLFGEILDGRDAERVGLVWRCVEDDELLPTAQALAAKAAAGPPELVRRFKQSLRDVANIDNQQDAMQYELTHQAWSTEQPEFQANLAKLRAKISSKG